MSKAAGAFAGLGCQDPAGATERGCGRRVAGPGRVLAGRRPRQGLPQRGAKATAGGAGSPDQQDRVQQSTGRGSRAAGGASSSGGSSGQSGAAGDDNGHGGDSGWRWARKGGTADAAIARTAVRGYVHRAWPGRMARAATAAEYESTEGGGEGRRNRRGGSPRSCREGTVGSRRLGGGRSPQRRGQMRRRRTGIALRRPNGWPRPSTRSLDSRASNYARGSGWGGRGR